MRLKHDLAMIEKFDQPRVESFNGPLLRGQDCEVRTLPSDRTLDGCDLSPVLLNGGDSPRSDILYRAGTDPAESPA